MKEKWIWLPDWASDLSLWEDDLTDASASASHTFVPYEKMAQSLDDVYAIEGLSKADTVVGWGMGCLLLMLGAAKRPKGQNWIFLSPYADCCDEEGPWNSPKTCCSRPARCSSPRTCCSTPSRNRLARSTATGRTNGPMPRARWMRRAFRTGSSSSPRTGSIPRLRTAKTSRCFTAAWTRTLSRR